MHRITRDEEGDQIGALFKEAANGVGHLVANHVKLARLELLADVKTLGRRIAMLVVIVSFAILGYVFCCLGLAVSVSRWVGLGGGLCLLGGMHLIGGTAASLFVMGRLRGTHWIHESGREMGQSVSTLSANILDGTSTATAASECKASGAPAMTFRTEGGLEVAKP